MSKAYVNGVECTIYGYAHINGVMVCRVKYSYSSVILPVIADLVEVVHE